MRDVVRVIFKGLVSILFIVSLLYAFYLILVTATVVGKVYTIFVAVMIIFAVKGFVDFLGWHDDRR